MAGVKKKKKEKDGSSNIVLVIFVVFLFLVNIGLGSWVYYALKDEFEARVKQRGAEKSLAAEKLIGVYYSMLYRELRLAVGDPLGEKEVDALKVDRDDFWKVDYGKFSKIDEPKDAAKKLLLDLQDRLGVADNKMDLRSNYKQKVEEAENKIRDLEVKLATLARDKEYLETVSKKLKDAQREAFDTALAKIDEASKKELEELAKQSDSYLALQKSLQSVQDEVKAKDEIIAAKDAEHDNQIKNFNRQIKMVKDQLVAAAAAGGGAAPVNNASLRPLVLDISSGKPLWDQPLGKIIRVDTELNQVAINIGSAQGAKPEVTFNIFAPNSAGRAEKQLKGSLEIIRVVDANTSLARITSLYDADGREILLNDLSRSRILRESEAPIRAGDLLFNLFWGSRVAIAGYVNISGDPSENPAEQIRQMDDFKHMLQRNGMQVDAYVDMRDGKIRGELSPKTRYLILGGRVGRDAPVRAPAMKEGKDADADKDKDKDAARDLPGDDRSKAVDASMNALIRDSIQRGLLLISADNFVTMIGYRRPRAANDVRPSEFTPRLPDAGVEAER